MRPLHGTDLPIDTGPGIAAADQALFTNRHIVAKRGKL
jgi:hypothetical protein